MLILSLTPYGNHGFVILVYICWYIFEYNIMGMYFCVVLSNTIWVSWVSVRRDVLCTFGSCIGKMTYILGICVHGKNNRCLWFGA